MVVKSSAQHYSPVAVIIHWLSALLIIALLASGFIASNTESVASKVAILRFHIPAGIAILLLTLIRILWWCYCDKKPAALKVPMWQGIASHLVHGLFYIIILGMSASGIGMLIVSGAGSIIFSSSFELLPNFWNFLPRIPHGLGARVLFMLVIIHIAAVIYHQYLKKDQVISRIWFRS